MLILAVWHVGGWRRDIRVMTSRSCITYLDKDMLYLSRDREEQKYIKFIILTFLVNYCRITQFKSTAKVSPNTSVLLSIVSDTLLVEIGRRKTHRHSLSSACMVHIKCKFYAVSRVFSF